MTENTSPEQVLIDLAINEAFNGAVSELGMTRIAALAHMRDALDGPDGYDMARRMAEHYSIHPAFLRALNREGTVPQVDSFFENMKKEIALRLGMLRFADKIADLVVADVLLHHLNDRTDADALEESLDAFHHKRGLESAQVLLARRKDDPRLLQFRLTNDADTTTPEILLAALKEKFMAQLNTLNTQRRVSLRAPAVPERVM